VCDTRLVGWGLVVLTASFRKGERAKERTRGIRQSTENRHIRMCNNGQPLVDQQNQLDKQATAICLARALIFRLLLLLRAVVECDRVWCLCGGWCVGRQSASYIHNCTEANVPCEHESGTQTQHSAAELWRGVAQHINKRHTDFGKYICDTSASLGRGLEEQ
jgi:hypothetical protein